MKKKPTDPNIVKRWPNKSDYNLQYCLYDEKGDKKEKAAICFFELPEELRNKHFVLVSYKPAHPITELTVPWIRFCKSIGLLPEYIEDDTQTFQFKITEDTPISLLYVYLCCARHLQDDEGYIRVILHLVDCGMDPYMALSAAAGITITRSIHNFLMIESGYGAERVDLSWAIAIRRYLKNPKKYDPNTPWKGNGLSHYGCHATISKATQIKANFCLEKAFDDTLSAALYAETDQEAQAIIDKFKAEAKAA